MIANEKVGPAVRALLNKAVTDEALTKLVQSYDREGKGAIDFADFLSLAAHLLQEGTSYEDLV